jgi:hypothetical protein
LFGSGQRWKGVWFLQRWWYHRFVPLVVVVASRRSPSFAVVLLLLRSGMNVQTALGFAFGGKAALDARVLGPQRIRFRIGGMSFATRLCIETAHSSEIRHARFGGFFGTCTDIVVSVNAVFALTACTVKAKFLDHGTRSTLQRHALVLIHVVLSSRHDDL